MCSPFSPRDRASLQKRASAREPAPGDFLIKPAANQIEDCHAQRYPALLAAAHADEEGVEAVGLAVLAVPGGHLEPSPIHTYLARCWQVPPTPPGRGLPLQESPNTRSCMSLILGLGQDLKESVCEEKAKAVLGKIVARELAQEVLKSFRFQMSAAGLVGTSGTS